MDDRQGTADLLRTDIGYWTAQPVARWELATAWTRKCTRLASTEPPMSPVESIWAVLVTTPFGVNRAQKRTNCGPTHARHDHAVLV